MGGNSKLIILTLFLMLFLFSVSTISALIITEVELNPEGGSSGFEWIELYNDKSSDIDVSNWTLYDGLTSPRKIYKIQNSTIVTKGEYYIIELSSSKLNNDGDFVTLYDSNNNKIDETLTLKDTTKDNTTRQLCNNEWLFLEQTKGKENGCGVQSQEQENQQNNQLNNSNESLSQEQNSSLIENNINNKQEEDTNTNDINDFSEDKILEISTKAIILNPKDIKSDSGKSSTIKTKTYAKYSLIMFFILIILLFVLKKVSSVKKNGII